MSGGLWTALARSRPWRRCRAPPDARSLGLRGLRGRNRDADAFGAAIDALPARIYARSWPGCLLERASRSSAGPAETSHAPAVAVAHTTPASTSTPSPVPTVKPSPTPSSSAQATPSPGLREGPSLTAKVLSCLRGGAVVAGVDLQSGWMRLHTDRGREGWASSDYLRWYSAGVRQETRGRVPAPPSGFARSASSPRARAGRSRAPPRRPTRSHRP